MTELEKEVFSEAIKDIKSRLDEISCSQVILPSNYNSEIEKFKELSVKEIELLAREGWDRTYKLRSFIENKVDRLEKLFIHLTQQK